MATLSKRKWDTQKTCLKFCRGVKKILKETQAAWYTLWWLKSCDSQNYVEIIEVVMPRFPKYGWWVHEQDTTGALQKSEVMPCNLISWSRT